MLLTGATNQGIWFDLASNKETPIWASLWE